MKQEGSDDTAQPKDAQPSFPNGLARQGASKALTKATGSTGAKDLVSKSSSDGSMRGDSKELIDSTKTGVEIGTKVGGAHGAAIGAVAGAGIAVAKNKRTRRRLLVALALPTLVMLLAPALVASLLSAGVTQSQQNQQVQSQNAAMADGLTSDDINAYLDAAQSTGTSWTLLAAMDWSAGRWAGAGDPPYGITDVTTVNKELATFGLDPLTVVEAKDRRVAGYAIGRLLALKVSAATPTISAEQVDAGASLIPDPDDPSRQIRGVDPDDADGVAAHEATKKALESAVATMPSSVAKDGEAIFAAAFRWSAGQEKQQGTAAAACSAAQVVSFQSKELPTIEGFNDDQIESAALIIKVGQQEKLPVSAWQIALMTSLVESSLLNIHFGADDSLGLFQQRPSMGWGTASEITDPIKATEAFFGIAAHTKNPGLTDIKGWERLPLEVAAQTVQISALPDAYAEYEDAAALLIKHLEGISVEESPECDDQTLGEFANCPATPWKQQETPAALGHQIPPDALRTLRCGHRQFPAFTTAYTYGERAIAPGEHGTGRAVDWMVPGGWKNAKGKAEADKIADWLVQNWKPLGVHYVIWDNKIWNVERDSKNAKFPSGWRPYSTCNPPDGTAESCGPTGAHLDHVHVTLWGDRGVVDSNTTLSDGKWGLPMKDNYQLGSGVCTSGTVCWGYGGHTGQDLSIFENADVLAVAGGKVTQAKVLCPDLTNAQRSGNDGCSYGRFVVIDHGGGVESYVAHLNDFGPGIKVGATVKGGQVIGKEGNQGHSYGAHLHFEIRKDGAIINPIPYLEKQGVQIRCDAKMTGSYSNVPLSGVCD